MTANPVLFSSHGADVSLVGFPATQGSQTFDQVKSFNEALASKVSLERWNGVRWQQSVVLDVHPASPERNNPYGDAVLVKPLSPGTYRLLRDGPSGQVLERVVWVAKGLPADK